MKDFEKIIHGEGLTLVDFFATWCGPCRAMMPVVERVTERLRGRVTLYKIDIDDRHMDSILRRYKIQSVPTLLLFRRGEVLWRSSGLISYQRLYEAIEYFEVVV